MVWGTIEFVHIRFRRAMAVQGVSVETLPFKAAWYPWGAYGALGANAFLILFQGLLYSPGCGGVVVAKDVGRVYGVFEPV